MEFVIFWFVVVVLDLLAYIALCKITETDPTNGSLILILIASLLFAPIVLIIIILILVVGLLTESNNEWLKETPKWWH